MSRAVENHNVSTKLLKKKMKKKKSLEEAYAQKIKKKGWEEETNRWRIVRRKGKGVSYNGKCAPVLFVFIIIVYTFYVTFYAPSSPPVVACRKNRGNISCRFLFTYRKKKKKIVFIYNQGDGGFGERNRVVGVKFR